MPSDALRSDFLALSEALTGFSAFRLSGTGLADDHLATLVGIVGADIAAELTAAFRRIETEAAGDEAALERGLRVAVMSDPRLGPVARNLIRLWYVGVWAELPPEWRASVRAHAGDRTFVPSPEAYVEGLLWPAVGAGPAGAKPLGYGMWAKPPRIETV